MFVHNSLQRQRRNFTTSPVQKIYAYIICNTRIFVTNKELKNLNYLIPLIPLQNISKDLTLRGRWAFFQIQCNSRCTRRTGFSAPAGHCAVWAAQLGAAKSHHCAFRAHWCHCHIVSERAINVIKGYAMLRLMYLFQSKIVFQKSFSLKNSGQNNHV